MMTGFYAEMEKALETERLVKLMTTGEANGNRGPDRQGRWRAAGPYETQVERDDTSMEALDTLLLSRIQFAANISFHILFPDRSPSHWGWSCVLPPHPLNAQERRPTKWMAGPIAS